MHLICFCGAIQSVVMLEPVDVYLGKKDKENLMSTKAFNLFQYISVGFFLQQNNNYISTVKLWHIVSGGKLLCCQVKH